MSANNLLAPDPIELPDDHIDVTVAKSLTEGGDPRVLAARHPESSAAWAALAQIALDSDDAITAYAFARTGYHRGLDTLRKNGWRGTGPVPYSHEPNRGVLAAIAELAKAAQVIGEDHEHDRCKKLLEDCDGEAPSKFGIA